MRAVVRLLTLAGTTLQALHGRFPLKQPALGLTAQAFQLNVPEAMGTAPSFHATPHNSVIGEVALALLFHKHYTLYASGTAFVIAPYLALTAKHVIDDFFRNACGSGVDNCPDEIPLSIIARQYCPRTNQVNYWRVRRVSSSGYTDIAALHLEPANEPAHSHKWRVLPIDLNIPPLGSRLSAFGFPRSEVTVSTQANKTNVRWGDDPSTTVGTVTKIFELRRDRGMITFPCMQTNARFDPGMSGGPVFTDAGRVCGLISANLPPTDADQDHISYVALLWPAMSLPIHVKVADCPETVWPLLDLAEKRVLGCIGHERVKIERDAAGQLFAIAYERSR